MLLLLYSGHMVSPAAPGMMRIWECEIKAQLSGNQGRATALVQPYAPAIAFLAKLGAGTRRSEAFSCIDIRSFFGFVQEAEPKV